MPDKPTIRVFLSSPGDVNAERGKAREILDELKYDPQYKDKMDIEIIAWDDPHSDVLMPRTLTPQEAINRGLPRPSQCQVVITIFWGRMGTPLDETAHGLKADGTPYWSGTEWAYLDAVKGSSASPQSLPIVYLYRRTDKAPLPTPRKGQTRGEAFAEYGTQLKRVEDFFKPFRDSKTGAFKAYYHEYDSLDTFDTLIKKHLRILLTHAYERLTSKGKPTDPPTENEVKLPIEWDIARDGSPFPSLKSFEERHEKVYFGRAREVAEVIKRIASQRLQVIVGASGSGKSSLVKAGVLPRLRDNALPPSARWHRVIMRPTHQPFLALAEALIRSVPALRGDPVFLVERCETLARTLQAAPENLDRTLRGVLAAGEEVVLFVDQFEEVFTLAQAQSAAFVALLRAPSEHLHVLLTIRSDFYDTLLPHLEEELRESTFTLSRPSPLALLEMVKRPAAVAGLTFEAELAERLVDEAGTDSGSLALIAYTLDELYKAASERDSRTLTTADYAALGGVQRVIGVRAGQVFAALKLADPEQTLQRVFHALVTVDERSTRQTAERQQFAADPEAERLINAFVDARLLTSDQGQLEVAHEALLREWKLLADWITRSRDDRSQLRLVEREAEAWDKRGRTFLPSAERLQPLYAVLQRLGLSGDDLVPFLRDYLYPQAMLLAELDKPETSHQRRLRIGNDLALLGDPRRGVGVKDGVPEIVWLLVAPGGEITIGKQKFTVQPFYIAQYLVTFEQYQAFVKADDGWNNPEWWADMPQNYRRQKLADQRTQTSNNPRDRISWYQAVAFARWLDAKYRELGIFAQFLAGTPGGMSADGRAVARPYETMTLNPDQWQIRLPTEWEWQWAAQGGVDQRRYPSGKWQPNYANTSEAGLGQAIAVGMYPQGKAKCEALDMAGNLLEWCLNDYIEINIIDIYNNKRKVLRGGSFRRNHDSAAASYRNLDYPSNGYYSLGFRIVCAASLTSGTLISESE